MGRQVWLLSCLLISGAASLIDDERHFNDYETSFTLSMPTIGIKVPVHVISSHDRTQQKVEYYGGLQVDINQVDGHYRTHNPQGNPAAHQPQCEWWYSSPEDPGGVVPGANPTGLLKLPLFYPLPDDYVLDGNENVNGRWCQRFVRHVWNDQGNGTMTPHSTFYWDKAMSKLVRWVIHGTSHVFNSHHDVYIFDYISFKYQKPEGSYVDVPVWCEGKKPDPSSGVQTDRTSSDLGSLMMSLSQKMSVQQQNLQFIEDLNREHDGKTTFAANQFLHLPRKASRRSSVDVLEGAAHVDADYDNVDWTRDQDHMYVAPVKDMGICNSHWAFGFIGPLESRIAIAHKADVVPLSEQFIIDCTWSQPSDGTGNCGCHGGRAVDASDLVVEKYGGLVPTSASYGSYLSADGICKDIRNMDIGGGFTGWQMIPTGQTQAILDQVREHGPVNAYLHVIHELYFYSSGILDSVNCVCNSGADAEHAVVITGYGVSDNKQYYIIRNSWSVHWGEKGYLRIARDRDCCASHQAGHPVHDILS